MSRTFAIAFLILSLGILVGPVVPAYADGQRVYKWTDADGVTHYSQTPPPAGTPGVEDLDLKVPPAPPYSGPTAEELELKALQERTRALEKALEEERRAREEAEAQQEAEEILPPEFVSPEDRYGLVYPWRPPLRPPRRRHPIGPPPLKPPETPNPAVPADIYQVPPGYYTIHPRTRPPAKRRPPAATDDESASRHK
jgi:hypothetical protein